MKKTFFLAALLIGLMVCAGGHSDSEYLTSIGRVAPQLYIKSAEDSIALDELRGNYVLVNFWNSVDAASRRDANLYTAWLRRHLGSDLRLVGINFDESEGLFNEIVRLDSLEATQQHHVSGDLAKTIIDSYSLGDGYGSVLISPGGKIIAHNPTDEDLDALFAKRDPRRSGR